MNRYQMSSIGKIGLVTDSRGTTTYSYDARQRLIEQKEADGKFLRYGYDGASNRTLLATPTGTSTFTYDKYNQLATVSDPTGNLTTYTYDKAGNLTQTIMPNAVLETRSYDTLNRLTQIQSKKGGTVLFSATYTLDNAGMRTKVVETGRTVDYTYDNLYRLLSENDGVSSSSYSYDPTGNRLTKTNALGTATYIYDGNDRLLSDGTTTYTYDANGNKLTETKAGVTTTYTWDAESRLKGSQSAGTNTVYDYDYSGIRVSQSVNGVETRYLVDKNRNYAQVLEEYAPNGTVNATYIYGNDLISQSRNAIDSFYGYDGLGSTRVLTDELGVVTDTYAYDAYGTLTASTGTTQNNYLYAGEQFDKGLNQYYLRDRYYGTDIGRFTQRDRFEGDMMQPLSLNRYGYTHGNPVNNIDPSGMFSISESLVAIQGFSTLLAQQLVLFSARAGVLGGSANGLGISGRVALIVGIALFAATALHSDEPENTGIPAIIWGLEFGQTTIHNYKALHGEGNTSDRYESLPIQPILPIFTYKKGGRNSYAWYNVKQPCKSRPKGMVCDEFPYATTVEGGKDNYVKGKVSLASVPSVEQVGQGQGTGLQRFYSLASINNGDKFGVWATYKSWGTAYFTKDRREGVRFLPPFPLYVGSGLKQKDFENEYAKNNT